MVGAHGPGFIGVFLPQEKPSFPLFTKSFTFLNICQNQDIWDLNFTRGFSAPAMHGGVCYGKMYQKKKKTEDFYVLTSLHETNWKFYFCPSSEFSYLNVHNFYSNMQISSADPNLKKQFLLYTC